MSRIAVSSLLFLALAVVPSTGSANADADLCQIAARNAASATGVPERLLLAITLTETRHGDGPWPWTLNMDGEGVWFSDQAQAEAAAEAALDAGIAPDVGCFQISTRWHGDAFPSITAMIEPGGNALYAARHLRDLHSRYGNWSDAVAAYHSQDSDLGAAYLARVAANLSSAPSVDPPPQRRRNDFPLLLAGEPATRGSVVPRLVGRPPLVGGP